MDSEQAKQVLLLYRPSDVAEAEMREALEQARRDPELRNWFDQHCATQAAMRARFNEIPLPPGLKERILTGYLAHRKIVWWRSPVILAAAAAVALLVGLTSMWLQPRDQNAFAAFREKMVSTALRDYRMNMVTTDLGEIREYLQKNQAHGDYVLTKALEKLPGEGCAILRWHGRLVSLICLDAGGRNDLYLFVINRSDLSGEPTDVVPQFANVNKLMTASWSGGNKTYVLAGKGDEETLRKYF